MSRMFSRLALLLAVLACPLAAPSARASLIGDNIGGCFNADASALSLASSVAECLTASSIGTALNFTVVDPGFEFEFNFSTRRADFGADTITISYGIGSANFFSDLFIFTDLDVTGVITGLTLIGLNPHGITTAFSGDSISLLVPECPTACNFSTTFRIETSAVPVPGTLALLGLALAGFYGARRKPVLHS